MDRTKRDRLTDPDGKSAAYQAHRDRLAKRMELAVSRASKGLSLAVARIIGELKASDTFRSKQEAYDWLKRTPNMSAVQALLDLADTIEDDRTREKLIRRINSGAKVYRASRMDALNMAIRINHAVIIEGVRRNLAPVMRLIADDAFSRQTFTIQKQLGVGWALDIPPVNQIVRGMNSTLDKMADWYGRSLDDKVRDTIIQGMVEGKTGKEIARRVEGTGLPRARARAVSRTVITTVANEAELSALRKSSATRYEYVATLDERTCPVCGGLDGKTFPLDDAKAGVNFPPMHPNCRCTHIAAFADEMKTGQRIARDGKGKTVYVPESMTYEQWKRLYHPKYRSQD